MGYQDYFLVLLPGSIALIISLLDKYTFAYYYVCLQWLLSLRLDLIGKADSQRLIRNLYEYARNLCSVYDISFCMDESCCFLRHKHLAFQCEYNDDETLASYAKGNYD